MTYLALPPRLSRLYLLAGATSSLRALSNACGLNLPRGIQTVYTEMATRLVPPSIRSFLQDRGWDRENVPRGQRLGTQAMSDGQLQIKSRAEYRILLVEDDALVAETVNDVLSAVGYAVVGLAATADDAVRLAEELRPDLVLMDINLRGSRDGVEAASEIAQRLGISSLFVTAMSSSEIKARTALFLNAGFLLKPVRQLALTSAIDASRAAAAV